MDDIKLPKPSNKKPRDFNTPKLDTVYQSNSSDTSEPYQPEPLAEEAEDLDDKLAVSVNTKSADDIMPKKTKSKLITKKRIIIILVILLVFGLAVAAYLIFIKKDKSATTNNVQVTQVKKVEVKKEVVSPLTGKVLADENLANRPVTGIMIENSPDARPQSGLTEADMVYEAIAEGGITRFLVVYQESQPQYIGPVRSARPYYLDFIMPLDGSFGHVGGSPEALADIKTYKVKDLDQFSNGGSYTRITERYAPHNVYTSFEKLDALNKSKGYTKSTYTPLPRKPDVPQTPTANIIDFSISSSLYSPRFTYDSGSNKYLRSQGGTAHTDLKSNAQISPKVVVALVMEKGYDPDGYHTDYKTTGSGKAYVFQDGIVSEATWSKKDRQSSLILTDKNGFPLKLNAGQTWFSLVSSPSDVNYRP